MARPRIFDEQHVLNAAMLCFWQHGYEGTSMSKLMAAMDMNKGSIYKAFGHKHDVYIAVLERYLEAYAMRVENLLVHAASPMHGIAQILMRMIGIAPERLGHVAQPVHSIDTLPEHHALSLLSSAEPAIMQDLPKGCFMVFAMNDAAPHYDDVAAKLEEYNGRVFDVLSQAVARGQELGEIRADLQPSDISARLQASMNGFQTLVRAGHSAAKLKQMMVLILSDLKSMEAQASKSNAA